MWRQCIPNSTNSWEAIYEVPELDAELKQQMIDNPWETQSDSFYFVGATMIMHNKGACAHHPGAARRDPGIRDFRSCAVHS